MANEIIGWHVPVCHCFHSAHSTGKVDLGNWSSSLYETDADIHLIALKGTDGPQKKPSATVYDECLI